MNIPDTIDTASLELLAKEADAGLSVVEAADLLPLCEEQIGCLDLMIEDLEQVVTNTIDPTRWLHFIKARRMLKNARRQFQAAIKT